MLVVTGYKAVEGHCTYEVVLTLWQAHAWPWREDRDGLAGLRFDAPVAIGLRLRKTLYLSTDVRIRPLQAYSCPSARFRNFDVEMHFCKSYAQILLSLPPDLRENAISYRQAST